HLDFLNTLQISSTAALHARVIRAGTRGITIADAVAQTGCPRQEILAALPAISDVAQIANFLIGKAEIEQIREAVVSTINAFHQHNPLVAGISKEELRERLPVPAVIFEKLLNETAKSKKIELAEDLVRLPGRGVVMKDEEAESKKVIEAAFASAGLKVPALKDVLAGLKIDKARAQKIVTLLLRDKILLKISDDLVFHFSALDVLRKSLATEKMKSPKLDVAQFKALAGVSRKYAIPLLEYLDREHVTRRVGDERIIL
ncbi:MAG: SelB C-terminal domain-containing protein, partial [Terriglobales bacterium]